jgi:hypothetical protein
LITDLAEQALVVLTLLVEDLEVFSFGSMFLGAASIAEELSRSCILALLTGLIVGRSVG